jgi:hypothetical protein
MCSYKFWIFIIKMFTIKNHTILAFRPGRRSFVSDVIKILFLEFLSETKSRMTKPSSWETNPIYLMINGDLLDGHRLPSDFHSVSCYLCYGRKGLHIILHDKNAFIRNI